MFSALVWNLGFRVIVSRFMLQQQWPFSHRKLFQWLMDWILQWPVQLSLRWRQMLISSKATRLEPTSLQTYQSFEKRSREMTDDRHNSLFNNEKAAWWKILISYFSVYSPQLIDVAAAAQTSSSQEALMGLLSFEDDYAVDYPERYLLAAAYSTHPSEALIRDLMVLF